MSSSISGATDYSSLFSSLSTNSSKSTSSSSNLLADYASIKNGSYAKLAKSYYGKSDSKAAAAAKAEEDKTKQVELTSTKGSSSKLSAAANALIDDKSVFQNKIKTKDKDGNETEDYDRDKISKLVNNFVDSYNSLVDSSAESSNNSVLRSGVTMVRTTLANENLLNKVGITIGDDNKLSIDEDTLKKADVGTLKSLFSGQGSYASNIQSSASSILRASENALNSLGGYSASGTYNQAVDTGSLYSSFT